MPVAAFDIAIHDLQDKTRHWFSMITAGPKAAAAGGRMSLLSPHSSPPSGVGTPQVARGAAVVAAGRIEQDRGLGRDL